MRTEDLRLLKRAKIAVRERRLIKLQLINNYFYVYIFLAKDLEKQKDHILTENSCDCNFFLCSTRYIGMKISAIILLR